MEDINTIYYNKFGIAFQWKRCAARDLKKIQMVFRNTGFFLTENELLQFSKCIEYSFTTYYNGHHEFVASSKSILLETPANQISMAVSYSELIQIQDLVKGTFFNLNFNKTISEILSK